MKGVVLTAYGEPATGIEFRELPEPASPGAGHVLVGIEYAPINFSDILVAQGLYPLHPQLPSVIGRKPATSCSHYVLTSASGLSFAR
jgi:NADPH:quinone reductase-like Zn-dependent oxidoreductase